MEQNAGRVAKKQQPKQDQRLQIHNRATMLLRNQLNNGKIHGRKWDTMKEGSMCGLKIIVKDHHKMHEVATVLILQRV